MDFQHHDGIILAEQRPIVLFQNLGSQKEDLQGSKVF
jgi:hypothetical protein